MKFSCKVGNGPMNKRLNFGGNPDYRSGDTGKTCLGGGMPVPVLLVPYVGLLLLLLVDRNQAELNCCKRVNIMKFFTCEILSLNVAFNH